LKSRDGRKRALFDWLVELVKAAQSATSLIYWRKALHEASDHWPGGRDSDHRIWEGRVVHFASFGAERGTNAYGRCTLYVQVGEFHRPRPFYAALIGATRPSGLTHGDLEQLAAPATQHKELRAIEDMLLAVQMMQDSARCAIRNFDQNNRAAPAKLLFVGVSARRLITFRERLWPGAKFVGPKRQASLMILSYVQECITEGIPEPPRTTLRGQRRRPTPEEILEASCHAPERWASNSVTVEAGPARQSSSRKFSRAAYRKPALVQG
jgi:hypothetical protein